MANAKVYVIGERAISAGHEIHGPNKTVTPEIMGISKEIFDVHVKKGTIKEKAAEPAKELPKGDRRDVIVKAIGSLFDDQGAPISIEDFTSDGKPKVEALEEILKDTQGFEGGISGDERNEAWAAFEKQLEPNG